MKKRTVSILMTAILAAGVLAGCGSSSSGAAGSASTDEAAPAQETTAESSTETAAGSSVQVDASADGTASGTAESSAAQITVQPNGDDHLAKILAAGKITVATEGEWSPFTYHDADTN